ARAYGHIPARLDLASDQLAQLVARQLVLNRTRLRGRLRRGLLLRRLGARGLGRCLPFLDVLQERGLLRLLRLFRFLNGFRRRRLPLRNRLWQAPLFQLSPPAWG